MEKKYDNDSERIAFTAKTGFVSVYKYVYKDKYVAIYMYVGI